MTNNKAVKLLRYTEARNITSSDEKSVNVQSHSLNLPALEILKLGTEANLRHYIPGSGNGENNKRKNAVHRAIRRTLDDDPDRFIIRNSGFTVTATSIKVDDSTKTVEVENASVFNGAQSQGTILEWAKDFYEELNPEYHAQFKNFFDDDGEAVGIDYDFDPAESPFHVRVHVIVDPDPEQVVLTAIARNTSTQVKSISQAGAKGFLNDLAKAMKSVGVHIQMNETDQGEDTRFILQKALLLVPPVDKGGFRTWDSTMPHGNAEKCLKLFMEWADKRDEDPESKKKYDFVIQMAPIAHQEYQRWERHPDWNKMRLQETAYKGRLCHRDKNKKIVWVARPLVFPLVSALSAFVNQDEETGKWSLSYPPTFHEDRHIQTAVDQFREIRDLVRMARTRGVYTSASNHADAAAEFALELAEELAKAKAEAKAEALAEARASAKSKSENRSGVKVA